MRIIFKNFKLKILALLSAVVFWIFIIVIQNSFYQFPEKIKIQPFNLAPEFSVVNNMGDVTLTLNGDEEILKTLTAKDFTAYVDLQGMGMGESLEDILVTSKNSNVTILKTDPDQTQVIVDEVAEKKIPIKYIIKGKPKEGYEVSKLTLSQNTIGIKGAKSSISQIIEAVVTFSLDGTESSTVSRNGSVKIFDANEKAIPNVQIDDSEIKGDIEIEQVVHIKTVGVEPSFIGELSEGWVGKISVKPQTVTLQGDPKVLSTINALETQKIDLRTISGNTTLKTKLRIPKGTTIKEDITEVNITLEITTK